MSVPCKLIVPGSSATSQSVLEQTLASSIMSMPSIKKESHNPMIQTSLATSASSIPANNITNMTMPDMKNSVNMMQASNMAAGLNLGLMPNIHNMQSGLAVQMISNQLDNLIGVTTSQPLVSMQNSHINTATLQQQHQQHNTNGFAGIKREHSPNTAGMMNNNGGIPGLNINVNSMQGFGSIFDPTNALPLMPMQMSQLQMKKDEKLLGLTTQHQQMPQKMDGRSNEHDFYYYKNFAYIATITSLSTFAQLKFY